MESLDKKILKCASGEQRNNPDQQRFYLGTFAERVLLTIPLVGIEDDIAKTEFERLLPAYVEKYQPLSLKLSAELDAQYQMFYMKLASKKGIPSTIIDESSANSPFALVLHTDRAVNLDETSITSSLEDQKEPVTDKKSSFWQNLFGK
ncbi:YueI family protein [Streptococcus catagoni]|uniref:YueI family protein n=1 Tax=Streptococcus catagoni TaxID=2654874 RepID=UPI00140AFD99|nr:YueI family protein [Streptococcus catagoni]